MPYFFVGRPRECMYNVEQVIEVDIYQQDGKDIPVHYAFIFLRKYKINRFRPIQLMAP